jgi:lysophospholipid acyltransferase (LPLAT)-like uncharacterized protein
MQCIHYHSIPCSHLGLENVRPSQGRKVKYNLIATLSTISVKAHIAMTQGGPNA